MTDGATDVFTKECEIVYACVNGRLSNILTAHFEDEDTPSKGKVVGLVCGSRFWCWIIRDNDNKNILKLMSNTNLMYIF